MINDEEEIKIILKLRKRQTELIKGLFEWAKNVNRKELKDNNEGFRQQGLQVTTKK